MIILTPALNSPSTPSCLAPPLPSSLLPPSHPPFLSFPGCLSPLSLPGVVAMAREPAQMAGQLAFRGRAPQLKLPPFFPSFLLLPSSAQTFGLQLFMSGKPLSRRARCEGKGRVLQRGGLSQTHELSSDQWGHQYQWKVDKGASGVSAAAID